MVEISSCRICLLEFDNASIKKTTTCQHEFCEACLNKWLETHNTCPICRSVLHNNVVIKPGRLNVSISRNGDLILTSLSVRIPSIL